MYYRKQGDIKRRKRLQGVNGHPWAWYYNTDKQRWVRLYKGKDYTENKRLARRKIRRITNRTGVYSKHYDDLWWNTW